MGTSLSHNEDRDHWMGDSARVLAHRTSPRHQNLMSGIDLCLQEHFLLKEGLFSQVMICSHRKPLWQSWHGLS